MLLNCIRPFVRKATPSVSRLEHKSLISVTGSQASEFLNGIVASAVPQTNRAPFFTAFIHAQGRVLYDVFVYTRTDEKGSKGYLIEYDSRPSAAPPLLPMLKRYVLRSKVKIRDVSEEYDVWAAWGSELEKSWETERKWTHARSGAVEPAWDSASEWPWGVEDLAINDRRAVGMGKRRLVKKGERPLETSAHDEVPPERYLHHRIVQGVPEGIIDIVPMQAFPMESNLDVMGALDFRKGCYVGQELTVRTYHTGVVRKRVLPVVIHSPDAKTPDDVRIDDDAQIPLVPETDIRPVLRNTGESRPRPRGTGKMLSSYKNLGLALLRLEHVEALQTGSLDFQVQQSGTDGLPGPTWSVSPYWPYWWPRQTVEEQQQQ